jgi:hypothetical protein
LGTKTGPDLSAGYSITISAVACSISSDAILHYRLASAAILEPAAAIAD